MRLTYDTTTNKYQYMVDDTITGNLYELTESEREFLVKRIKKGYLEGRVGDFLYKVRLSISPNNSDILTEKAKKFTYRYITENVLEHGDNFRTISSQTISLWRGDYGLSISDLKSFRAPLQKYGNTYIVIDMNITVYFTYKP